MTVVHYVAPKARPSGRYHSHNLRTQTGGGSRGWRIPMPTKQNTLPEKLYCFCSLCPSVASTTAINLFCVCCLVWGRRGMKSVCMFRTWQTYGYVIKQTFLFLFFCGKAIIHNSLVGVYFDLITLDYFFTLEYLICQKRLYSSLLFVILPNATSFSIKNHLFIISPLQIFPAFHKTQTKWLYIRRNERRTYVHMYIITRALQQTFACEIGPFFVTDVQLTVGSWRDDLHLTFSHSQLLRDKQSNFALMCNLFIRIMLNII